MTHSSCRPAHTVCSWRKGRDIHADRLTLLYYCTHSCHLQQPDCKMWYSWSHSNFANTLALHCYCSSSYQHGCWHHTTCHSWIHSSSPHRPSLRCYHIQSYRRPHLHHRTQCSWVHNSSQCTSHGSLVSH